MAGYSGTPLWRKLGLADGQAACVLDPPPGYMDLVAGPAPDWGGMRPGLAFAHLFVTTRGALEAGLARTLPLLRRDGTIWVSWPKRSSGVDSEVTEDTVREVALPTGLVDVKVCAVDATWSGLKLVIRKELR